MRHNKKINHLGRKSAHRQAMLSNMAASLILHKRIITTLAKAKALRVYVEPLITRSKDDATHSRRVVFSYLQNKFAVTELFREVAVKVANRPGGYTRIIKLGKRLGDNAEIAMIELVDFNENLLTEKAAPAKAKSTRRKTTKKTTPAKAEEPKAVVEPKVEEAPVVVESVNEAPVEEALATEEETKE